MKEIATTRNGFPCSAIEIAEDRIERLALAYRAGSRVKLTYTNLSGVTSTRECYVECIYMHLLYVVVKHRDFGYRHVCFERISAVN